MSDRNIAGQNMVDCQLCGEPVPHGHTLLRSDVGRICWFCYTDEQVDDDREWDDEDDGPDWDDDAWYE